MTPAGFLCLCLCGLPHLSLCNLLPVYSVRCPENFIGLFYCQEPTRTFLHLETKKKTRFCKLSVFLIPFKVQFKAQLFKLHLFQMLSKAKILVKALKGWSVTLRKVPNSRKCHKTEKNYNCSPVNSVSLQYCRSGGPHWSCNTVAYIIHVTTAASHLNDICDIIAAGPMGNTIEVGELTGE